MSTLPPTPASDPLGNVSAAADQETVFYEGSPKLRGEIGLLLSCLLAAVVVALIPIVARMISPNSPTWLFVVCWLLALLILVLPAVLVRKNKYRISNYRIDYERGLLGKQIDTMELWHVDDIKFEQSFFNRLMGVGRITVLSDDQTTPSLELKGLPNPRPLFDTLKQRIISVKRQRGVIKMDMGT